jgi:TonB-like protein
MATVRRVHKVLGKRAFFTISAPRPTMKNISGREGTSQPVIEGNPLPVLSNSAALLSTGVSLPPVPPLTQPMIQIQVGSFFSPDPLQSIGSGRRNGQRGVYLGGFDGSGEPVTTSVRLISKPTPIYSDEGRSLRIQGDVVVYVDFRADRTVRVIRIVRRLGHGLDEAAAIAVEGIRFKPATVDGRC